MSEDLKPWTVMAARPPVAPYFGMYQWVQCLTRTAEDAVNLVKKKEELRGTSSFEIILILEGHQQPSQASRYMHLWSAEDMKELFVSSCVCPNCFASGEWPNTECADHLQPYHTRMKPL